MLKKMGVFVIGQNISKIHLGYVVLLKVSCYYPKSNGTLFKK